jgi:colanic acid/amylovoran biosynthesis glycosyltransferase
MLVKSDSGEKLGYLISQYPAVNHAFVLREVRTLRNSGFDVYTVSVRKCDRDLSELSADEADEHRRTFCVIGAGVGHAIVTHLKVFMQRPWRYLAGLGFAWSLSRGTPRVLLAHTLYFAEAVVAGEYFQRQGLSLIHTHFSSTVLLILSRIFGLRYSLTVHGSGEFEDVVGFHMAEKVAGATFVATISHYGCSQVMKASDPQHWHKVQVLRLGIDPTAFAARPARSRSAAEAFKLVFVGRLAPAKGLHMLIEAVDLLRHMGRKVKLTVVGDGPTEPALRKIIVERHLEAEVSLAGACNHDKVSDFYRESDAFVLASFAEGVPVVLMEAMAMELPCIATRITGIPELIENGVDGLLVPPASARHIADAVIRLMDDPQLAQRLGEQGRKKVAASYDLARNTQRLADVFRTHLPLSPAIAVQV